MWLYHRILNISWTAHITNVEVLRKMRKERVVIKTVKIRKLQYQGHLMRNEQRFYLLQSILQGQVLGKRGVGRPRISWLRNLRTWFDMNTTDLFRTAVQKLKIACMISNIRNG